MTRRDDHYYNDDQYDDEHLDDKLLDEELEGDENRETIARVSGWGISVALHAIVFLLLGLIIVVGQLVNDSPPVRATLVEPPPPPPEQPRELRELQEVEVEIISEVEVESPVVTQLDIEIEEIQTEDPEVSENSEAKGREEAVASSETGGSGAFMAIGASGGASGMFGSRTGGGKKRALGRFGGTRASESAVEAALRWFMRHQSPNGMWDVDGYPMNCTLPGPKCEPGTTQSGDEDAAITGYALLCYLGAGYDHRTPNKYRRVVRAGLDWLVANQKPDGSWDRNYENGVAAMALAEAYAMTSDANLREPAQLAINFLLSVQNNGDDGYGGLGWDYLRPKTRNDSSVSGWVVMALKSAQAGGLNVGNGLQGSKVWFERAWEAATTQAGLNPTDPYEDISVFPYTWDSATNEAKKIQPGSIAKGNGARTAIGLCVGVFLGHGAGDIIMETMANEVMRTHLPTYRNFETMHQYYMYYNTIGIFQVGGDRWTEWNSVVRDALVAGQRKSDDCFDGSWDWQTAGNDYHGANTGRTLSTAYCCLSLQVYYRYLPVAIK